jgi:hypothetical protein
MAVKPSRVIIWTTPYKQLYKDPAVFVALEGRVGQIDEVPHFDPPLEDVSTMKRIEKAIGDADSKYATLWQLYVFISDGLYYTGILQKLLSKLPVIEKTNIGRDSHEIRLKRARSLLTVALKVVCDDWSLPNEKLTDVRAKENFLNGRMDVDMFRKIVADWSTRYEREQVWGDQDPAKGLSTVDISQYIHGYPLSYPVHHKDGRPCRDSRYKFDVSAEEEWREAEAGQATDPGNELIKFLKRCKVADPKMLSRLEFRQLTELYAFTETRERCKTLLEQAESDKFVIREALKALWLGGYPWPEVMPARKPLFPQTQADIGKWILDEVAILNPNVRRQFRGDLSPVVEILQWALPRNGGAVFDDFRERVRNEAAGMWNNVKVERLVNALKRRWDYPGIKDLPESDLEQD